MRCNVQVHKSWRKEKKHLRHFNQYPERVDMAHRTTHCFGVENQPPPLFDGPLTPPHQKYRLSVSWAWCLVSTRKGANPREPTLGQAAGMGGTSGPMLPKRTRLSKYIKWKIPRDNREVDQINTLPPPPPLLLPALTPTLHTYTPDNQAAMPAFSAPMAPSALQSLVYTPASSSNSLPTLQVLDQLLIPREKAYIPVHTTQDAWQVIRDMNVRGAPLIAIVACLGLAVEMSARQAKQAFASLDAAADWLVEAAAYLKTSRPTAVNLFTAMDQLLALSQGLVAKAGATPKDEGAAPLVAAVVTFAEVLLKEDVESNQAIGDHGATAILSNARPGETVKVMTHCNTGSLATAGYGTALGVIRSLHKTGRLARVYCTETRPYNQGARLTAFELVQDALPGTLVADSMASFLMATSGLDAVVVGADRIAANGDTANKIGTYQLAVAAKHHGVAFYVAAPFTSFDLSLSNGKQIEIEERPARELTHVQGVQVAPEGIAVWNPGFDVTPAALITGIITEKGVIHPSSNGGKGEVAFDVQGFLQGEGAHRPLPAAGEGEANGGVMPKPVDYFALHDGTLPAFLQHHVPHVWSMLGAQTAGDLAVTEVGDGNLNLVFLVQGPKATVVVKQALPYVRCVGESWPLTLDRAFYEDAALEEEHRHTPSLVPEVRFFFVCG